MLDIMWLCNIQENCGFVIETGPLQCVQHLHSPTVSLYGTLHIFSALNMAKLNYSIIVRINDASIYTIFLLIASNDIPLN